MITHITSFKRGLTKKILAASLVYWSVFAPIMAGQSEAMVMSGMNLQPYSEETDQIIVKYNNGSTMGVAAGMSDAQVQALSQRTGLRLRHMRRLANGAQLMKLESRQNGIRMQQTISALMADPNVEYAEPDRMMYPLVIPDDSRYNEQWHYYESTGGLNLPTAWDAAQGSGVVVAVIDTGYLPHADLVGNILPGYDMISDTTVAQDGDGRDSDASDNGDWAPANACYNGSPAMDSSWHGTHVSGTIAAATNNSSGVAGVAYNAKVLPVRVLGRCGGYTSDIADGMIWAAGGTVSGLPINPNPAQVLNLSLGGSGSCSITVQNAIDTARSLGTTVVVAAGNANVDAANSNPANCNGVVAVAATDRTGGRAYYSNYGSVVDVAAPGGDMRAGAANGILSTLNAGLTAPGADSYAFYQGTSMATPHVAGVAALLYEVDPLMTPDHVESTLKATTRPFPATCNLCGTGIVDATAAVEAAAGVIPPPPADDVLDNGVAVNNLAAGSGQSSSFIMDVPDGVTSLSFAISSGTGDADLYVKYGSAPTLSSYDCRPYLNGNNETCNISNIQAGTYYVMVQAYTAFSGVSLVGNYDSTPPASSDGFTETNLSASRRQWLNYTLDVPAGMSALNVNTSGGSGDADLYVRFGAAPTTISYDCRPYLNGNDEACSFANPIAGRWYIGIRAYRSFAGVTLDARYTP
jgi:serine protease